VKESVFEDFWSKHRKNGIFACLVGFLVLVLLLSALVGNAVISVATNANSIDDDRARNSAIAGLRSIRSELESITRDNAYWDDAARIAYVEPSLDWMVETWGVTTVDYPLYDSVAVVDANGKTLMAYRQGEALSVSAEQLYPLAFSDIAFRLRHQMASGFKTPVIAEFSSGPGGLMVIGAAPIAPTTTVDGFDPKKVSVLVFSKFLHDDDIAKMADTFSIDGLVLNVVGIPADSTPGNLSVPVRGFDGRVIAQLEWPSQVPGWKSLARVAPLLVAAFLVLFMFLAALAAFAILSFRVIRQDQRQAYLQTTRDPLSGLLNRNGLFRKLQNAHKRLASSGLSHSLLYLDLDGFKDVNDTYGHTAGDQLIHAVGVKLSLLAPGHARTARVGGDEFAILIPDDNGQAARQLARRIDRAFSEPIQFGGRASAIGASIGIALLDDPAINPEELVRRADVAMYHAKETGRGRSCIFAPEMDTDRADLIELEHELRDALAKGKIDLAFQPLVDAQTGNLQGMEALARWTSPKRGVVQPESFIRVAERSGLIESLGLIVLENALAASKAWPDLKTSVNVSPAQLRNPSFPDQVRDLLAKTGVKPSRLTLEITEGFLVRQPERAKKALLALRAVGVSIALDDFGAGYASIGYLRQFHFDRLKIDKSLVSALDRDPSAAAILQATVALANAFRIPVTAEGVEREEQAAMLRLAGCDELQGYLYGIPRTAIDIGSEFFPLPLAG
jgi:diguanylate cyclase (GGDEF)-like protein